MKEISDSHRWTVDLLAAHVEALRKADERFQDERDRRYTESARADREALTVAALNAHQKAEKLAMALDEYKETNNEWRKTVSDLIAVMQGGSKGMRDMWGWVVAAAIAGATIWDKLK